MRRFIPILFLVLLLAALAMSAPGALAQTQPTGQVVPGVETVTPQPDGSIVHEVLSGQSAWSIALAYNLTIADLAALNNLDPTPVIYPGQELMVRGSFTPTLSPTVTKTSRPPTRTPTLTRTPRPPTGTPTITATPTTEPFNLFKALPPLEGTTRRGIAVGLIVVCALGLLGVLFGTLRKG